MTTRQQNYVIVGIIIIIIASFVGWRIYAKVAPSQLDGFAQCLTDKGAVFYGAFWCPHCQNQKKSFGSAERLVSYVECSTPDGRSQTPECDQKGISGYPTWEFGEGDRVSGEMTLQQLADKTGCQLP